MINMWNKNVKVKKEIDLTFICNNKINWNKNNKIIKENKLVFIIDKMKKKEKEMNDLIIKQNYLNEENKIINSLEKLKEKK